LALIDAKAVDPMKLCAVFDEFEGIDALTPLREKTKFRFEPVCTATLYDDCYRMVRAYVRLGHSVEEIQEELDVRRHLGPYTFLIGPGNSICILEFQACSES
ncbi:hypothetical protein SARC_15478, partial [Sphaeroforma arctica JP610]